MIKPVKLIARTTQHMKLILRRILLVIAILLCVIFVSGVFAYHQYRAIPDWYVEQPVNPADQKIAANSADQKLADMFSWAAAVQAFNARQLRGDPGQSPGDSKTITLSDQELNAFLNAWNNPGLNSVEDKLSHYFTEGRLALAGGKLIVAGKSRDLGVIISAALEPSVDSSGQFHLQWDGLSAGELNIPRAAFSSRLRDVNSQLQDQLQRYQASADVDKTLIGNTAAVQAAFTRWMLDAINGQASDSTAFIPFDVGNFQTAEAVKLTAVQVQGSSIALTFQTLSPAQREAILSSLRQPYPVATDGER